MIKKENKKFRKMFKVADLVSLRSLYRMGIFFWVAKFQIFFGVLEIPDDFLGMKGRCWARAYV